MRQFFKTSTRRTIPALNVGWTPARIVTEGWYDASDLASIVSSGGFVSQWNDKSGKARHLVQPSGALQLQTGTRLLNSKNVLDGNGTQWIGLNPFPINADGNLSIFAVGVSDGVVNSSDSIYAMDGSGADFKFCAAPPGYNGPDFRGFIQGSFAVGGLPLTGYPFNGPSIYNGEFDKTGSVLATARVDGIDRAQKVYTTTLATTMNFTVLADKNALQMIDGAVGEVVVVHDDLTLATRQKIEGYLAWKWGTVAKLDAGHPYKLAAP
jgi:hypothetical protein